MNGNAEKERKDFKFYIRIDTSYINSYMVTWCAKHAFRSVRIKRIVLRDDETDRDYKNQTNQIYRIRDRQTHISTTPNQIKRWKRKKGEKARLQEF